MFLPLIPKEALFPSLLNKHAAARQACPSRMSGAIDLIPAAAPVAQQGGMGLQPGLPPIDAQTGL